MAMIRQRWVGLGLARGERFRRIKGHGELDTLVTALGAAKRSRSGPRESIAATVGRKGEGHNGLRIDFLEGGRYVGISPQRSELRV